MTMPLDDLIDQFLDAAKRMVAAKGDRRASIRRLLIRLADQLRDQRDRLLAKLNDGWDFLRDNPDRPDYDALNDRWEAWLHGYERIEDALAEALGIWCPIEEEAEV